MGLPLRLLMLGSLQIEHEELTQTPELLAKGQALLCYLALMEGMHSRLALAGLLWRDMEESYALRNLRVNLSKIRKPFGDYLIVERRALGIKPEVVWVDVQQFEALTEPVVQNGRLQIDDLETAVALYRGDLLEELNVVDAPAFEDWLRVERARLCERYLATLRALVDHYLSQHDYNAGVAHALRWKTADPLDEEAYRRLMLLYALNGQRGQALATYEACGAALKAAFGVLPDQETEELHRQIEAGELQGRRPDTGSFLKPKLVGGETDEEEGETAVPFLAPPAPEFFVGRDVELAGLRRRFERATIEARTFALVGLGGIGKTTLATEAAHALRDYFPDGVLWADAKIRDPLDIAETWAAQYGYQFRGLKTLEERAAALRSVLNEKQALLIFDDVFHASKVKPLLPTEGKSVVLVTSRNADLVRVLEAEVLTIGELTALGGRALLAEIVGEARVQAEEEEVAESGALLQYHPLALTLAAKIVALRPLRRFDDLVTRLRQEKLRLDLNFDNVEVRATFALSWNLLDETHRRAFRLLAVFGGRRLTVAAFCAVAELGEWDAQDRLDMLVSLSLLGAEATRVYRQHALLADFASEKLAETVEGEGAKRRLVAYYLTFAEEKQQDYEALQPEWENLSAAIETAHGLGLWAETIRFTELLKEAWFANGRHQESLTAFNYAHQALLVEEDDDATLADFLYHIALIQIELNNYANAEAHLFQANQIYKNLNDLRGQVYTHYELSNIALERAEHEEAINLLVEMRKLAVDLQNEIGVGIVLHGLARVKYHQGHLTDAILFAKQALKKFEKNTESIDITRIYRLLVDLFVNTNQALQAKKFAYEAINLSEKLNDQGEIAGSLLSLAKVNRIEGEHVNAIKHANSSLKLFEQIGDLKAKAIALTEISLVKRDMGEYEEAIGNAQKSLEISTRLNSKYEIAYTLTRIGTWNAVLGNLSRSQLYWGKALPIAKELQIAQLIQYLGDKLDKLSK